MFDFNKLPTFQINLENFFSNKKKNILFSKKRGVSEVISAILLLGITVAGAAILSVSLQDSDIGNVSQFSPTVGSSGTTISAIKLMGYDTRDTQPGEPLAGISGLENKFTGIGQLCTVTCGGATSGNLPNDAIPGTEFILLDIKNMALQNITIRGVVINDISHTWEDTLQPGTCLDLSNNLPGPGKYPASGKFSFLVPVENIECTSLWKQFSSNVLGSSAEVRVLVKLSSTLGASDIALNTPLRVSMDTEKQDFDKFLILSGSLK